MKCHVAPCPPVNKGSKREPPKKSSEACTCWLLLARRFIFSGRTELDGRLPSWIDQQIDNNAVASRRVETAAGNTSAGMFGSSGGNVRHMYDSTADSAVKAADHKSATKGQLTKRGKTKIGYARTQKNRWSTNKKNPSCWSDDINYKALDLLSNLHIYIYYVNEVFDNCCYILSVTICFFLTICHVLYISNMLVHARFISRLSSSSSSSVNLPKWLNNSNNNNLIRPF